MPKKRRRRRWRLPELDPQQLGRLVFIGAVGLYVLACAMPMSTDGRPVQGGGRGVMMLLYGAWGLLVSLFYPFLLAIRPSAADFRGWLQMLLMEVPWMANPLFWWGLWHLHQGRMRAAWVTAAVAVGLALSFLVLFHQATSGALAMPAYWCWVASMVWLAAWCGFADFQAVQAEIQERKLRADTEEWA